jgi:hypothetical protein
MNFQRIHLQHFFSKLCQENHIKQHLSLLTLLHPGMKLDTMHDGSQECQWSYLLEHQSDDTEMKAKLQVKILHQYLSLPPSSHASTL